MANVLAPIIFTLYFFYKVTLGQPNVEVTFTVDTLTTMTATLNWDASQSTFAGITYSIGIVPNGPSFGTSSNDGSVFSSAGSTAISNLNPGTLYTITVTFNDGTDTQDVSVDSFNAVPLPPTINTPGSITITSATVTWTVTGSSIQDTYVIELTSTTTDTGEVSGHIENILTKDFSGLVSGHEYTLTIKAKSGEQESSPATTTFVTVPRSPTSVTVAAVDTGTLQVTWVASPVEANKQDTFVIYVNGTAASCTETSPIVGDSTTCTVTVSGGPGARYNVDVKSRAVDQESAAASDSGNTKPLPPTTLTPSITTTTATVTWTADDSSVQSKYLVDLVGTDTDKGEKTDIEATSPHTFNGLASGHTYTVTINAQSGKEMSTDATTTFTTVPLPPTDVTVTVTDANNIQVTWTPSTDTDNKQDMFVIYVGGSEASCTETSPIDGDSTTCTVAVSGDPGTRYDVEVKSRAGDQESIAASGSATTKPATPTTPSVSSIGTATATLTWSAGGSSTQDEYEYTLTASSDSTDTTTNTVTATTHTFMTLKAGETYTFSIVAVSNNVKSDPASKMFTTKPLPPSISTSITPGTNSVTLSWSAGTDSIQDTYVIALVSSTTDVGEVSDTKNVLTKDFTGLASGHAYTLTVKAKSGDKESDEDTITFVTAPTAATDISFTNVGTTSMDASWTIDADTKWDLVTLTLDELSDGTVQDVTDTRLKDEGNTYTFTGLMPGHEYEVTVVVVVNTNVESGDYKKKQHTVPHPPSGVTVTAVDTKTIQVKWEVSTVTNNRQDTFVIYSDNMPKTCTVAINGASTECIINVASDPAGTRYVVDVKSKAGTQESSATTGEGNTKPLLIGDITAPTKNVNQLVLHAAKPANSVMGNPDVTVSPTSDDINTVFNSDGLYYVITIGGLTAGTNHAVTVTSKSGSETGTPRTETFSTKPAAPTNLVRKTATTSSLLIGWTAPVGVFQSYRIVAVGVDTTLNDDLLEYELTSLTTAGANYSVTLYASSNGLNSDSVSGTFRIKPNPPQNIVLSSVTSTSFTVSWDAPGGEVTGYDIEGVAKGENERTHTFDSRTQGTEFTIKVISKADEQTSSEATTTVVTLPNKPGAIQKGDITTSTAVFSWTAPTEGGVTGYIYTMVPKDTSGSKSSSVVARSVSETGLYAGATYDIKVWSYFNTTVPDYTYQESDQSTNSVVTLVPLPPTGFTVIEKTTTSFKITWTEPANTILKEYNYKIYKSGESNDWIDTVAKGVTEISFSGGDPGFEYTVEIWTEVDDTSGGQVESVHKMTSVTIVPASPSNLRNTSKSRTTIDIAWDPPSSGTFDEYRLTVSDTSNANVILGNKTITKGTESDQITGLTASRSYKFSLVTVSGSEVSAPFEVNIATNTPDTPDLTVTEVSPTSIDCSWAAVDTQVATASMLQLKDVNGTIVNSKTYGANTFMHTFDDLKPGQYYTVAVTITVDGADTTETKNIVLTPLAVSNFMTTTISETEVGLSWDIDSSSHQDEFIINDGDKDYTETYSSGTTMTRTIKNLDAGRQYAFTIHAKVTHSNLPPRVSPDATSTVTTYPLKVPTFNVLVNNDNTVKLSWAPDSQSTQTSYKIRYESSSSGVTPSPSNPIEVVSPRVEHTITNLYPGAQYTFYIKTVSGTKESRDESQASDMLFPLAPSSLSITTLTTNMTVMWGAPQSIISSYKLEYTKQGLTEWTTMSVDTADTSKLISGLVPGQEYTVRMFGISGVRESQAPVIEDATLVPVMTADMSEDVEGTSTNEVVITYTEETGDGVFDDYIFSINAEGGVTTITKLKSDTDRVVRFTGLIPGSLYIINARTRSGEQLSTQKNLEVLTEPGKPTVRCAEFQSEELTIDIAPPSGGISKYIIECSGTNCEASRTISPSGSGLTSATYQSLEPFNAYTFHVSVLQEIQEHEKTGSSVMITCSTVESAPGEVASFDQAVNGYDITLRWTEPTVTNGVIRNYTLSYVGIKQGNNPKQGSQTLSKSQYMYKYSDLTAGYNYTFTIKAWTVMAGTPTSIFHFFPILAPSIAAQYMNNPDAMKPKLLAGQEPTETDFMVQLVNPFTDTNGNIVSYSVIVATSNQELSEDTTLLKWSKAQQGAFESPYIAINECPDLFEAESNCRKVVTARRKREAEDTVDITIGGDQSCTPETTAYCNGKLSPDTNYYVLLRAYTETGLHADTPFSAPILTAPKDQTILIAVVCAVVAALIFIIVIVLVVILVRRKKRKSDDDPGTGMGPVSQKSSFKEPEITSIPVKIDKFDEHVTHMSADSDFRFAEEYEDLKQVGRDQSWSISELPVNRPKNRFTNILPYDHSRVKLLPTDDEEGSDYINANWMPGYNSKREFIVTQGALPATTDDFWRMMWEQNSRAIVMLTKCVERGREKCHHYWPVDSEPIFYGDLQVTVLNETKDPEWVITEFKLAKGEISRKVLHFHYTAWPDFDVPEKPQSLINFVRIVRGRVGIHGGPITVHCSAGVGRSGTYICIDRLLQVIQNTDVVDIYGIVYEMRRERCFMVQTERQYICIHQCLLCVIKGEDEDPENVYENGQVNPGFEEDDGIVMD